MVVGVTYRLSFRDNPGWAIGSTVQSLKERKRGYVKEQHADTDLYKLIRLVGPEGFDLTEVDVHYVDDIRQLRRKEEELIREHRDDLNTPHCLNTYSAHRTAEELKAWHTEWRRGHKAECIQYSKKWRESNTEQVKEYQRDYEKNKRKRPQTREEINKRAREYYHKRRAESQANPPC